MGAVLGASERGFTSEPDHGSQEDQDILAMIDCGGEVVAQCMTPKIEDLEKSGGMAPS